MKKTLTLITLLLVFFISTNNLNALTKISINGLSLVPEFSKKTKVYNVFTSSKTEIITITVGKEDDEIITGAGSISLKKGLNVIEILSYKNNELSDKYTLNITRGIDEPNKNEALLKTLTVSGYDIDFKSDIFDYTIKAKEEDKEIDINYIGTNPKASISLKGNTYLTQKENIIKIKVISENKKNTNTYTLKVLKEIKENKKDKKESIFDQKKFSSFDLKLIRLGLITLFAVIMLTLFFLLFIKKQKTFKLKELNIKKLLKRKNTKN